jgi:hypothetical protein
MTTTAPSTGAALEEVVRQAVGSGGRIELIIDPIPGGGVRVTATRDGALVSARRAAEMLGVSYDTLRRRYLLTGKLKAQTGTKRFRATEVRALTK